MSPTYFGRNAIWHTLPGQKVDVNAVTRANFRRDVTKSEFASVLSYKLRRKRLFESKDQSNEDNTSTEDALTSLQLLVIWGSNDKGEISVHALLIRHSNIITWNEDTLEKLHSRYFAILGEDHNIKDTWFLDDETVLMTTLKWREWRHTTEIIISEGTKGDDSMKPPCVPSSI
jgi:hypothetical protein